ncbi:MAG: amino acid--tRNA ligase-related protein [Candidatus Sericytochromatia bacterium]|nr:amino acid--tRNA ligase-related protein [Candidatus Sericytochromatia bacterium]
MTATLPLPVARPENSLEPCSPRRAALIRIWAAMFRGARRYVESQGFIGVHNVPEIVGVTGACENVDTLFKVDYFGKPAYLAQSDQLYLELITPVLGKVYAEIQSFRMEPEADDRHLCQFALFEIEHLGNLDELIGHLTGIVQAAVGEVLATCEQELRSHFGRDTAALRALAFQRITYTEAVEALQADFPGLAWGDDLKANHERRLTEIYGPCFLTHYPLPIKFFNMKQNAEDPRVVNSTDMLLPFSGESAGAAEREHDHATIERRLKTSAMYERLIALGGKDEDFAWYLDAHKDREIPLHSGAGVGMARVAQFILGVSDIREAVPFLINRDNLL